MKLLDILQTASVNLWRNKTRTILTIIAIFIGSFTVSLTSSVNHGVNDYIEKQLSIFSNGDTMEVLAKQEQLNPLDGGIKEYKEGKVSQQAQQMTTINNNDLEKIRKIKGIKSVAPYKMPSYDYMQFENGKKLIVANTRETFDWVDLDIMSGQAPNNKSNENQIAISDNMSNALGFSSAKEAVGKTVKLQVFQTATGDNIIINAKISGVLNKNIIQNNTYFTNKSLNERAYEAQSKGLPENLKNQYIVATAEIEDSYKSDEKIQEIKDALDKSDYQGSTIKDSIKTVKDVINAITGALILFGAIALLAASFGIVNTLLMSVQERTKEIGLMKAMGLSGCKIFTLFSAEAILIGFWGSLLGILGAIGVGGLLNNFASQTFLKGFDGFSLTLFSLSNSIIVMVVIMIIAFVSGTLPSRRAAKQNPIEALRYE